MFSISKRPFNNTSKAAKAAGLDIITWTLERSGRISEEVLEGRGSAYYYQSTLDALEREAVSLVDPVRQEGTDIRAIGRQHRRE